MGNQLKQDEMSRVAVADEGFARSTGVGVWIVIGLMAAALVWLAWEKWGPQDHGDIVGSAMLTFEKQNSLTVFSSRFDVVAESTSTPSIGPLEIDALQSRQAMIVPATVEYRLDLSGMDRADFAWDAASQTLNVELPGLTVSTPNIHEGQARYFTDGLYVSRDASVSLSRSNSDVAARRARDFAKNPEVMALARTAARDAVRQNLAIPLQVAGYGDVQVTVRFADDSPETSG
ncbi:hypothetical protein CP97_04885 [Aurantiacibacter atlanticus]|uniref:DUF4230 domain-containing protein n=1 Tax=Aurantiacibacter atlanticus TaxID=1648404 RepID=A0A0H4VFR8_9SPHN|nr:DUF4230 domain-containing protein [Aurantiacibacter atlanticus]AKQ43190.2 hypothetical protein CP97_04885 [Aurantiacibacter atlanticus]MDF1833294.1 DUF4230 domain-containing protein [Alteraurantiacibacter sp. bin_em_oilr2.035]